MFAGGDINALTIHALTSPGGVIPFVFVEIKNKMKKKKPLKIIKNRVDAHTSLLRSIDRGQSVRQSIFPRHRRITSYTHTTTTTTPDAPITFTYYSTRDERVSSRLTDSCGYLLAQMSDCHLYLCVT